MSTSGTGGKASFVKRAVAAIIDGLVGGILGAVIPVVGALLSAAYILTKDALPYQLSKNEALRNRSLGKRLLELRVDRLDGGDVDWATSIRRNIPLAAGSIIALIPVIGWTVGGFVTLALGLIELILVLSEANGRRLGDRFGNTTVVEAAVAGQGVSSPMNK